MSKRKPSRTFEDSEGEVIQGRWTKDEHQRFVEALSIHGKNWKKVEEYVGTRSGAQIRSHAQKFFNRLEKEFNKQFNGLKSSEIKQIFENKMFHTYYEGETTQKRQRTGSMNGLHIYLNKDFSDDDQPQQESMLLEQQQEQIKSQFKEGKLDLNLPTGTGPSDQITKYQQQQNKIQKKLQEITDAAQLPDDLLNEIYELNQERDDISKFQQIQNAYQSIAQEQLNTQDTNRPAPDESFFHFIIAKISRNQKIPNLSDLIQVQPKEQEEHDSPEVQRSRKQSFTFYNDQGEDNHLRYQSLKKTKKD